MSYADKQSTCDLVAFLEKVERKNPGNELLKELYKRHEENSVEALVTDLLRDASNTFGWLLTGPVEYAECVRRVADKLDIPEKDLTDSVTKNEKLILQAALKKYFDARDPAERDKKRKEIMEAVGEENREFARALLTGSGAAFLAALQLVSASVVNQVVARIMAVFLAQQAVLATTRLASLAVPFLNVIMVAWMALDIAGPAYRKIIPSVMNITLLRMAFQAENA